MSSVPTSPEQPVPSHTTPVMGRLDFFSVLFRATAGELYKIRRRLMSKILLIIGVTLVFFAFGFIALSALTVSNLPTNTVCEPNAQGELTCHEVDPDSEAAKQQARQLGEEVSSALRLPGSFTMSIGTFNLIGMLLMVVLIGSVVGGEYSIGTVRLLLTRGPSRTQFLLAKVLATLVCILIALVIFALVGIISGTLFNLVTGFSMNLDFLTGDWILHATLYTLLAVLGLFVYTMLALCWATLGRSTAAGIAGALVWWMLEMIVGPLLMVIGFANQTAFGDFLEAVPNYFIGTNISALIAHQEAAMSGAPVSQEPISDVQGLIVLGIYLVVFIGASWLITQRRDIKN